MRPARHAISLANRRRLHPAHGASACGRRVTRTANARSPRRRTATAFFLAGRGPALHALGPPRGRSRESPSTTQRAWSVGPRPTRDEDGKRPLAPPSNGPRLLPCRPRAGTPCARPATRPLPRIAIDHATRMERRPAADAGRGRRTPSRPTIERSPPSSLPAAGRHSMRPVRHEAASANRHRPRNAHGASACGRRGTRRANAGSPHHRTASAFFLAGRRPALHAPGPARDRSRESPATTQRAWSVGLGRRVTRRANAPSPNRRTDVAFFPAGRRPALHAPSPSRDQSRESPSTTPRAWSVGLRPTRDEDG
jgi:hypothetical protein